MPRLNGSRTTSTPAFAARAAVPSVEPSSITTISSSGSKARSSDTTASIEPASLYAGTIASRCKPASRGSAASRAAVVKGSVIGAGPCSLPLRSGVLSAPEQAVQPLLDRGRHRPWSPVRAVEEPAGGAEAALGREPVARAVEIGVLRPQPPERLAVRAPVLGVLRCGVPPVLDGHGIDLQAAPAVGQRVHPELPVLELAELRIEPSGVFEHLSTEEGG